MTFLSRILLINAAVTLAAAYAYAAEPAPTSPEKIPAVTVTAPRTNDAPAPSPTSPTDTQALKALNTSSGAVNFISADAVNEGRAGALTDILDNQVGVFAKERYGMQSIQISIRGSGLQRPYGVRGILLTQDGMPVNLADGGLDTMCIDPSAYSRATVCRGAAGLAQGSGTLGGTIDLVSLTGRTAPLASVRAEGGSYGYAKITGTLSSNGLLSGDTGDAVVTVTGTNYNGWRDSTDLTAIHVNSNVGMMLSANTENRFYVSYTDDKTLLPNSLTLAQYDADPRQPGTGVTELVQRRDHQWLRFGDRLVSQFDDAQIELAAGYQYLDINHPLAFSPYYGQTVAPIYNDVFFRAKADYTADLFGQKNRFTLGVTPTWGVSDDNRYLNPPGNADYGVKLAEYHDDAYNVPVYFEEDHYFTKSLAGTIGGRLDYSHRGHDVVMGNPADSRSKDYLGFSPSVGARYEFDDAKQQIYANVSRSFEAPTWTEFNTARTVSGVNIPTLDAQTATTLELGTRGEKGAFGWDLAYYYSFVDNELVSYLANPLDPTSSVTFNADDTRHQGVEAGFDVNLLGGELANRKDQQLVLRQVFAWNDFRFRNDPTYGDNRIAGIPQFTYRIDLTYRHPSGFYIGPNVELSSKCWADQANTTTAPSYVLLGAKAGFRQEKGFGCFVELRNMLDRKYVSNVVVVNQANTGSAIYNPGDGFGAYAGVEYKW